MNIVVIFGGESCEHDISIITGEQLIDKCNEYLYNIYPIYINKSGDWITGKNLKDIDTVKENSKKGQQCAFVPNDKTLYIRKGSRLKPYAKIDMAFVCLHGQRGEDGSVAGVLELSKIPYSSSSMCASAVCMDKCVFKLVAKGLGLSVVDSMEIRESEWLLEKKRIKENIVEFGYPIILKPSRQGSSIGIEICEDELDLDNKLKNAFKYDKKVLVERFVDIKKEVNVALFEDKGEYVFSNTEEPVSSDKILSFDNKYRKNSGGFEAIKRIVPADINSTQESYLKETALALYKSLDMFGVVRFDFVIDKGDKVYINEANTIPGSMANYLFDKDKLNYPALIEKMISNSVLRCEKSGEVERVFETDVLENGFDGFKK